MIPISTPPTSANIGQLRNTKWAWPKFLSVASRTPEIESSSPRRRQWQAGRQVRVTTWFNSCPSVRLRALIACLLVTFTAHRHYSLWDRSAHVSSSPTLTLAFYFTTSSALIARRPQAKLSIARYSPYICLPVTLRCTVKTAQHLSPPTVKAHTVLPATRHPHISQPERLELD